MSNPVQRGMLFRGKCDAKLAADTVTVLAGWFRPDDFRGEIETTVLAVADFNEQLFGRLKLLFQQKANTGGRGVEQFAAENLIGRRAGS